MRFIYTFLLFLLAANAYAQKVIPYNENIEEELWKWTRRTDTVVFKSEMYDEIWKHVIIRDLTTDQIVDSNALAIDYGVFDFYDPGFSPRRQYLMIKHHDCCTIVEYDFSVETIIKQLEFLTEFFEVHKDIPRNDILICMKHLVHIYEMHKIYSE